MVSGQIFWVEFNAAVKAHMPIARKQQTITQSGREGMRIDSPITGDDAR